MQRPPKEVGAGASQDVMPSDSCQSLFATEQAPFEAVSDDLLKFGRVEVRRDVDHGAQRGSVRQPFAFT